jgi:outer membrane biosynthesis protein TonB
LAQRPPEDGAERSERLRTLADERRRRERLLPWLAVVLSVAIHLLGLLLGAWWASRRPPEPESVPERQARIRFLPSQPQAEPAERPPDTQDRSDRDLESQAPEPAPEPPIVPEPPRPRPSPPSEPQPAPPEPTPRPEPEPEPAEPSDLSFDEKRERVKDLLSDWRSPTSPQADPFESMRSLPPDALRSGAVQFESKADVDWGPYAARVKQIVRGNWRIPTIAQVGGKGASQLHFYIACDGSIEELELTVGSGKQPLDISAENALALSNRLPPPPLPPEYCEDRVGVTWTFFYNMDERDLRGWYRNLEIERRRALQRAGSGG